VYIIQKQRRERLGRFLVVASEAPPLFFFWMGRGARMHGWWLGGVLSLVGMGRARANGRLLALGFGERRGQRHRRGYSMLRMGRGIRPSGAAQSAFFQLPDMSPDPYPRHGFIQRACDICMFIRPRFSA
jgi:hypothetical protein